MQLLAYTAVFALGIAGLVFAVGRLVRGGGRPPQGENSGWYTVALFGIAVLGLLALDLLPFDPPRLWALPLGLSGVVVLSGLWMVLIPAVGAFSRRRRSMPAAPTVGPQAESDSEQPRASSRRGRRAGVTTLVVVGALTLITLPSVFGEGTSLPTRILLCMAIAGGWLALLGLMQPKGSWARVALLSLRIAITALAVWMIVLWSTGVVDMSMVVLSVCVAALMLVGSIITARLSRAATP